MSARILVPAVFCLLVAGVVAVFMSQRSTPPEAAAVRAREPRAVTPAQHAEPPAEAPQHRSAVPAELSPADGPVQGEPEEQWLPVRVLTAATYRRDAAPVPGVEVAVGVGSANSPAAAVLATGTTDSEGLCELRLPWSVIEAARPGGGRIWARPSGTGWIEQTRHRSLPKTLEAVEIKLQPRRGFTVRGRLLGEHGEPTVGNAQAQGVTLTGEQGSGFGAVDSEGWFEVHVDHAGTYDIIGTPPYLHGDKLPSEVYAGTGALREVQIDAEHLPQDLTLRMQGSGVVRGRVQTATGQPVAGLTLSVSSVLLSATRGNGFGEFQRLRTEGLGAPHASVRTDTDGRFEVRGLRAGDFDVSADNERTLLTPVSIPSDGEPVVLVLDHPHMVVQLVDEAGQPWQGKLASGSGWFRNSPDRWDDTPRIVVVPTASSLARAGWDRFEPFDVPQGEPLADACRSFEVHPGSEYLVGILGGPGAWHPKRVLVPEYGGRVDVTLTLGEARELGTLSLTVTDATGPLTDDIVVRIEDPDTGLPMLSKDRFYRETWPLELRLPSGSYRLAVEGAPSMDSHHGTLFSHAAHGRFEVELSITPGGITAIAAHLPAGARIDLKLEGEAKQADTQAVVDRWGNQTPETLDYWARRAQIRLVSADRWPRPVEFQFEMTGSTAAGTHLGPHLPIGTQQTSELVPAGRYTLEARMPGGRVASVPVTLVDGETLSVTLEL